MTPMQILERFIKAKGLPPVGRVSGGPIRLVYYSRPGRVRVIKGRRI